MFYNGLPCPILSLCRRICSKKRSWLASCPSKGLCSPCQSRHDDCPKTFHSLRCGTLESFPEHLASVCASAAFDQHDKVRLPLRWWKDLRLPAMSSQRAGGVGKCCRWRVWTVVVCCGCWSRSMIFKKRPNLNPYHHLHWPTSLVSKPGDSRDLTL